MIGDDDILKFKAQGANTAAMLSGAETPEDLIERIKRLDSYQMGSMIFHFVTEEMRYELDELEECDDDDLEPHEKLFMALLKGFDSIPMVHIDDLPKDQQ
jgi:hypothetical protein